MNEPTDAPPDVSVQIDGQTQATWGEVLGQFADANLYQTWAYGAVRWGAANLSHVVLKRAGQAIAAAQLRIAKVPVLPAGVAYLRWGPMCQRKGEEIDGETVRATIARLRAEYCGHRGLVLQVIPGAFGGGSRGRAYADALAAEHLEPDASVPPYRTVLVDLSRPHEAIRKGLDQKWRNQLNASERSGLSIEVIDSREAYGEFLRLYRDMWERKQFDTSVDVDEFSRIQDLLEGPQRLQSFIARKDGEAVGALVCSALGETALYVLGATNERARELKASYFLHWQAMLWLQQRGARAYDLGGVDKVANPGGYHFKCGFGGAEVSQLPMHSASRGLLGKVVRGAVAWLRGRRRAKGLAARAG